MTNLITFLERLRENKIAFTLDCVRDAIMVTAVVPGERWEVEFFANGEVEVEIFRSDGSIKDGSALERLFEPCAG